MSLRMKIMFTETLNLNCYSKLKNSEKRDSTSDMKIFSWKEHDENCDICVEKRVVDPLKRKIPEGHR